MFKTKVLNKHLALALTSGLLLMANAVNAESIRSIIPDDLISKGNNVVVTQDTTGNPVFFTPSTEAYKVGDGSGTLTVNTNNTLGMVIFHAPENYDPAKGGVDLKGNLVLNVNLDPKNPGDDSKASGQFNGDLPWMSVNIDGNFELNATFNTNGQTVDNVYIPYFYSNFKDKDGQSSFSQDGRTRN